MTSFVQDLEEWTARALVRAGGPRFARALLQLLRGHKNRPLTAVGGTGRPAELREARPARREGEGGPGDERGLICIPAADSCIYGYLPTGSCASSWSICDAGNPPKVHGMAPADPAGTLEDPILGDDLTFDNNFYRRVDWISSNRGTPEKPDHIVLSWRSYAGRYMTFPPEAPFLFYRRAKISGLPTDDDSLTFLGACIADLSGTDYLIAAVMNRTSSEKLIGSAKSWVEMWMAISHWCPSETQPVYHAHYPIHFYARTWNPSGYPNDDAYHISTNPLGWRNLGALDCQSYTSDRYRRAFRRPRPLGGVHFQAESNGSSIQCVWTCVDHWQDEASSQLKDVFHVTGYQIAQVDLSGPIEIASVTNPEKGKTTQMTGTACVIDDDPGLTWDCAGQAEPPENPHPEWTCADPHIATRESFDSSITYEDDRTQPIYPDLIVAADFDRNGALVLAKVVHSLAINGTTETSPRRSDEELTREYWCDTQEPPEYVDDLGWIWTGIATDNALLYNGVFDTWNLVVSGGNSFSLPFKTYKNGAEQWKVHAFDERKEFGENKTDCIEAPGGTAYVSITEVGNRWWRTHAYNAGLITHAHSRTSLKLTDLDLRFGSCAWIKGEDNDYTGTEDDRSGSWSEIDGTSSGSGTKKTYNISEDLTRITVGVVDKGSIIEFASGTVGTSSRVLQTSTSWSPSPFPNTPRCSPASNTLQSVETTDAYNPVETPKGLDGLFDIDAFKSMGVWTIEDVRTDYGASDEHGNYLVSYRGLQDSEGIYGYGVIIKTEDAGLDKYWSYLSNHDALSYFGVDAISDSYLAEVGLL